jgi:hypothetical protein
MNIFVNQYSRGYLFAGLVLLMPTLARLSYLATIDAVMFFVIGVAVWGSLIGVVLYLWDKFRGN